MAMSKASRIWLWPRRGLGSVQLVWCDAECPVEALWRVKQGGRTQTYGIARLVSIEGNTAVWRRERMVKLLWMKWFRRFGEKKVEIEWVKHDMFSERAVPSTWTALDVVREATSGEDKQLAYVRPDVLKEDIELARRWAEQMAGNLMGQRRVLLMVVLVVALVILLLLGPDDVVVEDVKTPTNEVGEVLK